MTKPKPIGNHDTMASLAKALQNRFGDSIRIVVDPDTVRDWRKGNRLPRGTPPPPAKRGNYFIGREWSAWLERFIVPKHGHNLTREARDLAEQAQSAKYRTTIIEAQEAQINLDMLDGKYLLKSEVGRAMSNIGSAINGVLNGALQTRARVALREKFSAANLNVDAKVLDVICAHLAALNLDLKQELRTTLTNYEK